MLALKLMSSSLPLLVLHHLFFLSSLLSTLPPIFFILFKLPSHFPSTILLSSYLLFILLPFPYHLHTSPTIFIPPLSLTPTSLHPSSHIFSPLPLTCSLISLHPTPPLPQFHPISIHLPPFSLTLYILSNLHVPLIFLSSLSLPHTQWPICECDGKGVAPGALHLQHLPQATEQHYLCV